LHLYNLVEVSHKCAVSVNEHIHTIRGMKENNIANNYTWHTIKEWPVYGGKMSLGLLAPLQSVHFAPCNEDVMVM